MSTKQQLSLVLLLYSSRSKEGRIKERNLHLQFLSCKRSSGHRLLIIMNPIRVILLFQWNRGYTKNLLLINGFVTQHISTFQKKNECSLYRVSPTGSKIRMNNTNHFYSLKQTKWMVNWQDFINWLKIRMNNINHFYSSRQTKWMVIL